MKDFLAQLYTFIVSSGADLWEILALTVCLTLTSTALAALLGVPAGMSLASFEFRGKRTVRRLIQTLTSLPPVVAGLLVFMLLSRRGPLGSLQLLFTFSAMVIAQILLIFPIITSLTLAAVEVKRPLMLDTLRGLGLSRFREYKLIFWETRRSLIMVLLSGFSRSLSEVGAVMMVGGNIAHKTRVLTTAIMLETSKGHFNLAISLGVLLLSLSFIVNLVAVRLQEDP
ncbi:MAG: ABC transporter permease [Eubacteriales bacterium]|nr:ABC transporter permease [Eubacteriales bacterium]